MSVVAKNFLNQMVAEVSHLTWIVDETRLDATPCHSKVRIIDNLLANQITFEDCDLLISALMLERE